MSSQFIKDVKEAIDKFYKDVKQYEHEFSLLRAQVNTLEIEKKSLIEKRNQIHGEVEQAEKQLKETTLKAEETLRDAIDSAAKLKADATAEKTQAEIILSEARGSHSKAQQYLASIEETKKEIEEIRQDLLKRKERLNQVLVD